MPSSRRDLTDAQWEFLDSLIPEPPRRRDGRGRPWRGRREVLNGILFILRTGAPWADLPERYPPYQTCHRRFQQWVRSGVMRGVLGRWPKTCAAVADSIWKKPSSTAVSLLQKRGRRRGQNKRGKGTKIMAVADRHGLPITVCGHASSRLCPGPAPPFMRWVL